MKLYICPIKKITKLNKTKKPEQDKYYKNKKHIERKNPRILRKAEQYKSFPKDIDIILPTTIYIYSSLKPSIELL